LTVLALDPALKVLVCYIEGICRAMRPPRVTTKTTCATKGRAFETIIVKVVCVVGVTESRDP
jgi:hypothetical protein